MNFGSAELKTPSGKTEKVTKFEYAAVLAASMAYMLANQQDLVGLTAFDTQRIKESYLESDAREIAAKKAIMGALMLYLDFINMFVLLLQLFGQQREE